MGKRRGRSNAAPEVAPLDVDGVRTVAVVTVLWAAAVVVLVFFREQLVADGRGWWLWTGLAGVGFGLLALEYTRKRRDAYLDDAAAAEAAASEAVTSETVTSEAMTSEAMTPDTVASGADTSEAASWGAATGDMSEPGGVAAYPAELEDSRTTGPITAEPPGSTAPTGTDAATTDHGSVGRVAADYGPARHVASDHGIEEETTGHGGRRRARRARRAADASSNHRSDDTLAEAPTSEPVSSHDPGTNPATDPGTDPGAGPRTAPGRPVPDTAAPSAPADHALGHAEPGGGSREGTGQHVEKPPEFDTDVRAWLDLAEDDHPVTNHDTMSTRPIPPMRPQTTPYDGTIGDSTGPRSARERHESGELPPSTPRSTPYPGPARDTSVSEPSAEPRSSAPAQDDAETQWQRSHDVSVDSEFFGAVGPDAHPSAGPRGYDPDAPLLDDTVGGTQHPSERADDTTEEELDAGSTGTDGPYRGRRARRSGPR